MFYSKLIWLSSDPKTRRLIQMWVLWVSPEETSSAQIIYIPLLEPIINYVRNLFRLFLTMMNISNSKQRNINSDIFLYLFLTTHRLHWRWIENPVSDIDCGFARGLVKITFKTKKNRNSPHRMQLKTKWTK